MFQLVLCIDNFSCPSFFLIMKYYTRPITDFFGTILNDLVNLFHFIAHILKKFMLENSFKIQRICKFKCKMKIVIIENTFDFYKMLEQSNVWYLEI